MNKNLLTYILQDASMFLSKHNTLPVLSMFYFGKTIKATDMEKYFEYDFDTGVELCVPLTIIDILKNLDGDKVILTQDNNTLNIECDGDKFTLAGMPTSEYIEFPKVEGVTTTINYVDMMKGFTNVLPAIQEKNFSPIMTGIKISRKNGELVFAGTDSFRLHEVKLKNDGEDFGIVIPKINATTLSKVVNKIETVNMTVGSNMVQLQGNGYTVKSLIIQGNYPDYNNENIMPTQFNYVIKTNKDDVVRSLKKTNIFGKDINNFVKIDILNNRMYFSSFSDTKGKAEVNIYCEGDNISFGINGLFLLTILESFESTFEIKLVDSTKPITIKDISKDYFTGIIRPIIK